MKRTENEKTVGENKQGNKRNKELKTERYCLRNRGYCTEQKGSTPISTDYSVPNWVWKRWTCQVNHFIGSASVQQVALSLLYMKLTLGVIVLFQQTSTAYNN
jgi:hypothetical protein